MKHAHRKGLEAGYIAPLRPLVSEVSKGGHTTCGQGPSMIPTSS